MSSRVPRLATGATSARFPGPSGSPTGRATTSQTSRTTCSGRAGSTMVVTMAHGRPRPSECRATSPT